MNPAEDEENKNIPEIQDPITAKVYFKTQISPFKTRYNESPHHKQHIGNLSPINKR